MNPQQESAMAVIHGTKKPDPGHAQALHHLAVTHGLPERVTAAIEQYIDDATKAAEASDAAEKAKKSATESWDIVRDEAGRDDDLVDQAKVVEMKSRAKAAG
jgi:hypothetical protein